MLDAGRARGLDKAESAYSLEKSSGVSQSHIGKLLNGQRYNLKGETAAKLAKALGIRAEWLMTGVGPKRRDDPLASASPLDIALHLEADTVSPAARAAVTSWARAHPEVDADVYGWVYLLRDVQRQLTEGVPATAVVLPKDCARLEARAVFEVMASSVEEPAEAQEGE